MSSVLTERDRREIINSFRRKPEISPESFLGRVEWALTFYSDWREAEPRHGTKHSEVERRFGRLGVTLGKLNQDLTLSACCATDPNIRRRINRAKPKVARSLESIKAEPEFYERFYAAAETIADREGCPDYDAEYHSVEGFSCPVPIWPIEQQFSKAVESDAGLSWLERVARQAEKSARTEIELAADQTDSRARLRAGREAWASRRPRHKILQAGNRPNEPLHWLVRTLVDIYREAAVRPSGLSYDDSKEQGGEVFYFLHACLSPIGVSLLFKGLQALCRRAGVKAV